MVNDVTSKTKTKHFLKLYNRDFYVLAKFPWVKLKLLECRVKTTHVFYSLYFTSRLVERGGSSYACQMKRLVRHSAGKKSSSSSIQKKMKKSLMATATLITWSKNCL